MNDLNAVSRYLDQDNLVSWLQQLVRFPSEQTDLHEQDPEVQRFIKECVAPLAAEFGGNGRFDKMGNLILEFGPKSNHSLLFVAYAMTHPRAKMSNPFAAEVIDTQKGPAVRGRGVAEQKTSMAALFGAVAAALEAKILKRRLTVVVLTAGETGRHDAIESVAPEIECRPEFAIVCIGTDGNIAIGNKGRIDFDVIVHGKACHSSAPWHGINSITGAQRLLHAMEHLDLGVPEHPHFGRATLTPTAIDSAPKATHTVPDTVRITYDRRLLPGEAPDSAFETIRAAVRLPEPWSVECRLGPVMYPNEIADNGPLAQILGAAFGAAGHPHPEHFYCNFALDAGYFARVGTEAVMLGAGEVGQFHSSEESVLISDLVLMANVYYRIIEQCLAPPD